MCFKIYVNEESIRFRLKDTSLNLERLRDISKILHQSEMRSVWRAIWSLASAIVRYMSQSSANKRIRDDRLRGISLI